MQELEVTWKRVLGVWWLITWRSYAGAIVFGVLVAIFTSLIGMLLGESSALAHPVDTILIAVVSVAWTAVVIRMALTKYYGDFRIALVRD